MSLIKDLKIPSLVLLANKPGISSFSPAMFNQYWLHSNDIIQYEEIKEHSLFSPEVTQVISDKLNFIATRDQLQFAPVDPSFFKDMVTVKCSKFITAIPEIILTGLGINFSYYVHDENINTIELSKRLFKNESNSIASFFSEDDSKFGMYASKNINSDIRLKLDIKPVDLFDAQTKTLEPRIQFAFNFHSDLKVENSKEKVLEIFAEYSQWYSITKTIMDSVI